MPIMNSYSVVVVDQCVDANLLRRSAYKVFYAGNVQRVISSTIKITEKAFCLSSHYMVYNVVAPFSIYMIFAGSFIRFTWFLQAPLFDLHENLQAP